MKKKILIITTGGTLACVQNEKGLVPGLSSNDILSYISDITNLYDVDFYELFQLDSANIQPSNWQTMAETIYEKYTSYDGIVIFHGTDTMAYTASALSFMLLNIPIPVVITGSQLSILNPLADAVENCRCAIHMAGSGMPGIFSPLIAKSFWEQELPRYVLPVFMLLKVLTILMWAKSIPVDWTFSVLTFPDLPEAVCWNVV